MSDIAESDISQISREAAKKLIVFLEEQYRDVFAKACAWDYLYDQTPPDLYGPPCGRVLADAINQAALHAWHMWEVDLHNEQREEGP